MKCPTRPGPLAPPRRASRSRGQFNLPTVLALLVLLVVAVIALRYALQQAAHRKQEADVVRASVPATPAPETRPVVPPAPAAVPTEAARANATTTPRPDAHGLTFGLMPGAAEAPAETVHVDCHGEPKIFGRPHKGSCNPYQGDTACNIVLPVLCVQPNGMPAPAGLVADAYSGWVGGSLGASEPVMGALLDSPQAATALCERSLGAGWRAAEFHDGKGGWGLQGQRGPGLRENSRYWVHINDQPGNCWN